MYAWIWRHLPGDGVVRVLWAVTVVAAVLATLVFVLFPELDILLPSTDVDVGS